MENKDLVKITKDYYDSREADEFYHTIWGGEDIHVGFYSSSQTPIREASRKTVLEMIKRLPLISNQTRILDIGSGYGGAAPYLSQAFHCKVACLNLSEVENERNRTKNRAAGLDHLVSVTQGNFENLPFPAASFDLVWSQDAILHSNKKEKVFEEVFRVLKPGGRFIFTDPMQSDDCPPDVLKDVLARIHLEEMGSVKSYRSFASKLGMKTISVDEFPDQLVHHYACVLSELEKQYDTILEKSGRQYLDTMMVGLNHWVQAGKKGYLNWGILLFQKQG